MPSVRSLAVLALLAVLAGCRTRAPAAASPGPQRVTSIARPADRATGDEEWTTVLSASPSALSRSSTRGSPGGLTPEMLQAGPWELYGYAVGQAIPAASFSSQDAEVDTWITRLRLELERRLAYMARISFDLVYERAEYDFDDASFIFPPNRDPLDPIHSLGVRARYIQPFSETWGVFVFGSAAGDAEEGAAMTEGMQYTLTAGVGHVFPNGLQLGVGGGVIWRPEAPLIVIPTAQFVWEVNDHWELSLDGPELEAAYSPNDCWTWSLTLGLRYRRARLHDGPPGNSGIFTDSRIPLQLRVKWVPSTRTMLELRLGVDLYRELFFQDEGGDSTQSYRLDPTPHIGLRFRYQF